MQKKKKLCRSENVGKKYTKILIWLSVDKSFSSNMLFCIFKIFYKNVYMKKETNKLHFKIKMKITQSCWIYYTWIVHFKWVNCVVVTVFQWIFFKKEKDLSWKTWELINSLYEITGK